MAAKRVVKRALKSVKEATKAKSPCPPTCSYATFAKEMDHPQPLNRVYKTTRSNDSEDAHRDFDGWNVEEELARLRLAVSQGLPETAEDLKRARGRLAFILEAFSNLDEHLVRSGGYGLPRGWRYELREPTGGWSES